MDYKRRINVRGIIFHEGSLFCQQLTIGKGGQARDYWCTPGGGMEDGESLTQALHREMVEETGVEPRIGKLLFVQQFHDGTKEQLEFFFQIENTEDYASIDLSATSHGVQEIENCEFINPKTHSVLPAFLQTIDVADYIVNSRNVYVDSDLSQ